MRRRLSVFSPLFAIALIAAAARLQAMDTDHAVTVPMRLELDRPYIDVTLVAPDGRAVPTHAWVDTGGGAVLFSAGLARRLGLVPTGKPTSEEGHMLAPVGMPAMRLGDEPITLSDVPAFIVTDEPETLSRSDAAMQIPARILRRHVVIFDYPACTFTVAAPGGVHGQGEPVRTYIGESGMPVVWLSVAGRKEGFLLDTGGQYSMISTVNLHDWMKREPGWPRVSGAYGPANMLLPWDGRLEMLRIGDMQWGPFTLREAGAVGRPEGVYEKWMSQMLGRQVIGSIGGNVLRDFRITIDYPNGQVYLQPSPPPLHAELAMVGITLGSAKDAAYVITSVAGGVKGIEPGDRLLAVDGQGVSGVPYSRVAALLAGRPGETRALDLLRNGKLLRVEATARNVF